MARQNVMTPGSSGGSSRSSMGDDSFTFDDLLDSIIEREIKNKELLRDEQRFKDYFRTMTATPEEYTAWQDKQYAEINREEAARQAAEDAAFQYDEDRESIRSMMNTGAGLGGLGFGDIFKDASGSSYDPAEMGRSYIDEQELDEETRNKFNQQIRELDTLNKGATLKEITEALKQPRYTDEDLLGMGTGLTKEDLGKQRQWWSEEESGKPFRRTDADWEEYARVSDLYDAAKKKASEDTIMVSDKRSKKIKKRY